MNLEKLWIIVFWQQKKDDSYMESPEDSSAHYFPKYRSSRPLKALP